jgi:hypothetical protein
MRRGREQAELVKGCAAKHGCTPRAVRKWRDANDDRWIKFLAERAASGQIPVGVAALAPTEPRAWRDEELLTETQIRRLREAVADLFERAELAKRAGDLNAEMAYRQNAIKHVEALRRLEKDAPSIAKEAGDVVPRRAVEQALIGYAADVKARLQILPDRILTLFPALAEEIVRTLQNEVAEVMRSCAALSLSNGDPG